MVEQIHAIGRGNVDPAYESVGTTPTRRSNEQGKRRSIININRENVEPAYKQIGTTSIRHQNKQGKYQSGIKRNMENIDPFFQTPDNAESAFPKPLFS